MAIPVSISKMSHKCSTLSIHFLHQISLKLENKYDNISAILKPIFRKLTINQKVFPDISCVKFYPNSMSNIEHKGKISFAYLNKLQLSSHHSYRTCNNSAPLHGDFYTGFHPIWSRNVGSTGKNSFMRARAPPRTHACTHTQMDGQM
jgi:hypothetical protein